MHLLPCMRMFVLLVDNRDDSLFENLLIDLYDVIVSSGRCH